MTTAGLLLGAGEGRRLGGHPKARLILRGASLLQHGIVRLLDACDEIVAAVREYDHAASLEETRALDYAKRVRVIMGGNTRQETLHRLLESTQAEWIVIHEVARPFTPPEAFAAVLAAARRHGAAALFRRLPVRDSLGLVEQERLVGTVARAHAVALQTPLAFRREALLAAHIRARETGLTEDGTAALALRCGIAVHMVEGMCDNPKITYPEDWDRAQLGA